MRDCVDIFMKHHPTVGTFEEAQVAPAKRSRIDSSEASNPGNRDCVVDIVASFFWARNQMIGCGNDGRYATGLKFIVPNLPSLLVTIASFWCEIGEYAKVR